MQATADLLSKCRLMRLVLWNANWVKACSMLVVEELFLSAVRGRPGRIVGRMQKSQIE